MSDKKPKNPTKEPKESGSYRVLRGGHLLLNPSFLNSAFRYYGIPSSRINYIGFRIARTVKK